MPTYDYLCGACEHAFEHFQSMTSNLLRKCPECGERKLRRLIGSGAGVIFKGSGFYETDYKRAGQPSPEKDASSADTPSKGDTKGGDSAKDSGPSKDAGASKPSDSSKSSGASKDD